MAKNLKDLGLAIQKFVPGENGNELTEELKSDLEQLINESFRERDMELIPGYFSLPLWHNFEYMLLIKDTKNNNKIVGGLFAFYMRTSDGVNFMLYDKIFMHPHHRGNGAYKEMISFARKVDEQVTRKHHPGYTHTLPAGLRTSDERLSSKYDKISDDWFGRINAHNGKVTNYFVHLFGVKDPTTKQPIEEYMFKKQSIVASIASAPPTMRKIEYSAI